MMIVAKDPFWYKDAIFYELHVKTFFDSNADGVGDFPGLIAKLDYIQKLGVTAIWLLPFYPSPLRDDGYDVSHYKNINPSYGTMRDFRAFMRAAHRRGLRVIIDFVINHTSDQHPWFQRARTAKRGSRYRDFYVWSDSNTKYAGTRIIFSDTETSNWAWDSVVERYYWHRFFSHQPDLNYENPSVTRAIINVMRFWFRMGVDGMRLDAIPYLCEREGTNNESLPETHAALRLLRSVVEAEFPGRIFLAEANQQPEELRTYFGQGDECHMAFHFPLMPRMFSALAQEQAWPIVEIMQRMPEIPSICQWAVFLRNHDELTLEMVSEEEGALLRSTYAREPGALLNGGIRRRLAPLLENDRRKIHLMTALLLSMPGTPVLYYGEEIGMGDLLTLPDRSGVRTPMQWTGERNGGFSAADPAKLCLPVIADDAYGYQTVNAEKELHDPRSLLNRVRELIAVRRAHAVFGRGRQIFLPVANGKILAYVREDEHRVVLCILNLAATRQQVELDLERFSGCTPMDMLAGTPFSVIGREAYSLDVPAYAFYWLLLA